MNHLNIKKISLYGFSIIIFGSIISATVLIYFLFKLENIKENLIVIQSTHKSFLKVKNSTENLLTSNDIKLSRENLNDSVKEFSKKLKLLAKYNLDEVDNLWYICKKEINFINKTLQEPIFNTKNIKNKPLLHRRGELFFQNSSNEFYLLLIKATDSIEYLIQNENFILNEFDKLDTRYKQLEQKKLSDTKKHAILFPLIILILTIILATYIFKLARTIEEKLIDSIKEQNTLLSLFDDGNSVLFKWNNDENWSVSHVSDSVLNFLGYTKDEFLSSKISYASCIHKDDIKSVGKEVANALKDEVNFFEHKAYRVITKNGDIKWVIDHTVIVRDNNGNVVNFIGFIGDISDVKNLEKSNHEKEQMLFQQSKMAAMGEMIGNIAHQWRQPISVISMWANNIIVDIDMGKVDENDLRGYANKINEQTKHLSQTIDDFRNFFLPTKEKTTFTLKNSYEKTMALLMACFTTYNIEMVEDIGEIEVTALENELTQAMLNIIKNAKDVIEKIDGRKLIFVNIYKKDNSAIIEIIDNGGGVPEEIQEKIFEPYFTTKHKSQGTGIGLYMTNTIIMKHLKGKLSVENTKYSYDGVDYRGAKFIIEIPRDI